MVTVQGLERSGPDEVPVLRDDMWAHAPILNPVDNFTQRKNWFSPMESLWVYKLLLRPGPMPSSRRLTQSKSNDIFGALFHKGLSGKLIFLSGSSLPVAIPLKNIIPLSL